MTKSVDEATQRFEKALAAPVIPGVDALRALAIVMVVLFHESFPVSGPLGVMIFFVLSGFLITSLLLREFRKTGSISMRTFYIRRAYRIFPAFYASWAVSLIVALAIHEALTWWQVGAVFFYMADYGRAFLPLAQQAHFFMGFTWSLGTEEKFYLLWPLLLLALLRRRWHADYLVGGLIAAVLFYRAVLVLKFGVSPDYVYNAFEMRADGLLTGAFTALVLRRPHIPRWVTGLVRTPWTGVVTLILIVAANHFELHGVSTVGFIVLLSVEAPIAAVALTQCIYWGSAEWRVLDIAPIRFMARISYSLYLLHTVFAGLLMRVPVVGHNRTTRTIACVVIASLSYYLIEKPFLRLRDRRNRSRTSPSVDPLLQDGLEAGIVLNPKA